MFGQFTDIKLNGWVQKMPEAWRPYIVLARMDRPVGVWLLLLPGLWAIALASGGAAGLGLSGLWFMALFFVGAVAMRSAGCVINDLWDRDLDAKVERTASRPLASGALKARQALVFLAGLLLIGLMVLLQMNSVTIILGLASLPLVVAYPFMKRVTYWPQAFLGLTFNFGALMGWAAVSGDLSVSAFCLYLGGLFWTLGYDTIYAHQDKDDDALIGVRSTALKLGVRSKAWVAVFYVIALKLFVLALLMATSSMFGAVVALVGGLAMGAHMFWQLQSWDMNDQESCLRAFKSNRDFGLIVLVVMLLAIF
jgi:4-hydroxybenzoate polyprenyltransferase